MNQRQSFKKFTSSLMFTVAIFGSSLLQSCHSFHSVSVTRSTNFVTTTQEQHQKGSFQVLHATTEAEATIPKVLQDFDFETQDKLPWLENGYQTHQWKDHSINYIEMGDPSKPAIVLIHGFGASSYHWRYNLPILARDYHVFAFCKLGFGLSSKPVQEYSAEVWRDQTVDFLTNVVKKPATLVGNSLGGFTSLYTAATDDAKSMVKGVVLLNGAGRFRDPNDDQTEILDDSTEPSFLEQTIESIQSSIQRAIIAASFIITKQPLRIEQILKQVYPNNPENVDPELVESIRFPSLDPNAAEVFYRVIKKTGTSKPTLYVDDVLKQMDCPLLLCWGQNDPWIKPQAADKIQALYPSCQRININAGHCPHDEAPTEVNSAILNFAQQHS